MYNSVELSLVLLSWHGVSLLLACMSVLDHKIYYMSQSDLLNSTKMLLLLHCSKIKPYLLHSLPQRTRGKKSLLKYSYYKKYFIFIIQEQFQISTLYTFSNCPSPLHTQTCHQGHLQRQEGLLCVLLCNRISAVGYTQVLPELRCPDL